MFGGKKKLDGDGGDAHVTKDKENVEMKVVMMRENRVVTELDPARGDSVSEAGTLDRFLSENSDKVAVRRFSSLPPGACYTYGRVSDTRGARKLKNMGNKSQNNVA